ncbi:hypothetical protein HB777_19610 [Mesorhizobium loti]|nr:hypothetical protein HB777_19610 [Mesorhizobium loti]
MGGISARCACDTANAISGAPDPILRLDWQDANVEVSSLADVYGGQVATLFIVKSRYRSHLPGSAMFVFGSGTAIMRRRCPESILAILLLVSWALMLRMSLSHDVVYQMWVARQLIGGTRLYGEIVELNPPLWFWMAVPIERMAQILGATAGAAVVTAVTAFAALALASLAAIISDDTIGRRMVLLSAAGLSMLLIPLADFGQREHLALIGALPYAFLIARRADGAVVSLKTAATAGALAAAGFALKHYFVMVPILLELWLIFRLRRTWRPFRPETMVLGAAASVYAIAVFVFAQEYLRTIVPMLAAAYDGYNSSLQTQLLNPRVLFWGLAAIVIACLRKRAPSESIAAGVAAIGFALAYFAQQKGFRYHTVPVTGLAFFALCAMLNLHERTAGAAIRQTAIMVVGLIPVLLAALLGPYRNPNEEPVLALLHTVPPGSPVIMLTANPSNIWPMIENQGLVWPSRHFSFWMTIVMAKQLKAAGRLTPTLEVMAENVRTQTADDLICNPPDMILVDDLSRSKAGTFDLVAFFSENEEFRAIFSHYAKRESAMNFTAYAKQGNWRPENRPSMCRNVF